LGTSSERKRKGIGANLVARSGGQSVASAAVSLMNSRMSSSDLPKPYTSAVSIKSTPPARRAL